MKLFFRWLLASILLFNSIAFANDTISKTQSVSITRRIQVTWGLQTKTKRSWDGYAEIDRGEIQKVVPFIRHGMIDESKLVTKHSWKSMTYTDVEGVFLFVQAPTNSTVKIITKSHTFSFSLDQLDKNKVLTRMDGDIEIQDISDQVIYQIKGLEYGEYGSGSASISPRVAYVDSFGTWTITYTADQKIPVGGGIRILCHFTRTWAEPQFTDPKMPNFVSVRTTGKSRLDYQSEHRGLFEYPFTQLRLLIRVLEAPLFPGEQIIVVLGDKSGDSAGFRAPLASEKKFTFRIESCTEFPETGFPIYRRIKRFPSLEIKTALSPNRIFAVAPSIVHPKEPFTLKLVVEDKYRNTVEDYTGDVKLFKKSSTKKEFISSYHFSKTNRGKMNIDNLKIESTGIYRFMVQTENGLVSESNPILCQEDAETYKLFWGELHGHTQFSDGYGTADDYFDFARGKALLDFAAITDHDVELDAPDYTVKEMWQKIQASVSLNKDPQHFVTILGWEWSPNRITAMTEYPYGDHNVYYFNEHGAIFPTGENKSNSLPELYQNLRLENSKGNKVFTIPHVGGAISNLEFNDPAVEPLLEIYSVHGSFEEFGQVALDKGYQMGFVGGSDSHNGQVGGFPPGGSANHFAHGGLTAVYARDLSRASLYEAFMNQRCYATTGKRTYIDFKINGHLMGEKISITQPPKIQVNVIGENPAWKVELIKNRKVIHSQYNSFAFDNTITVLWRNRIDKSDLLDFESGFWGRRLRIVHWSGKISSSNSGVKFLAPFSFDFPKDNILSTSSDSITWESDTRGDYDGINFELEHPDSDILLSLNVEVFGASAKSQGFIRTAKASIKTHKFIIKPTEIDSGGTIIQVNPLDEIVIFKGTPEQPQLQFDLRDKSLMKMWNYYYVRVIQVDGEMAWSSPIWVQYNLAEIEN